MKFRRLIGSLVALTMIGFGSLTVASSASADGGSGSGDYILALWKMPGAVTTWPQTIVKSKFTTSSSLDPYSVATPGLTCGASYQVDLYANTDTTRKLVKVKNGPLMKGDTREVWPGGKYEPSYSKTFTVDCDAAASIVQRDKQTCSANSTVMVAASTRFAKLEGSLATSIGSHTATFEADAGHLFSNASGTLDVTYTIVGAGTGLDCTTHITVTFPDATPPTCSANGALPATPADTNQVSWSWDGNTLIATQKAGYTIDGPTRKTYSELGVATGFQNTNPKGLCYVTPPTKDSTTIVTDGTWSCGDTTVATTSVTTTYTFTFDPTTGAYSGPIAHIGEPVYGSRDLAPDQQFACGVPPTVVVTPGVCYPAGTDGGYSYQPNGSISITGGDATNVTVRDSNGVVVTDLANLVPGDYAVTVKPAEGHPFVETAGWSLQENGDLTKTVTIGSTSNCLIPVTVDFNLSATPPTCSADGSLPALPKETVGYTLAWGRTFDGPGTYTLTATPADGYTIDGQASKDFTVLAKLVSPGSQCPVTVDVAPLSQKPMVCTATTAGGQSFTGGSIIEPTTEHIAYSISGGSWTDLSAGTYTVTATPDEFYTLGTLPTGWTLNDGGTATTSVTIAQAANCAVASVLAAPPNTPSTFSQVLAAPPNASVTPASSAVLAYTGAAPLPLAIGALLLLGAGALLQLWVRRVRFARH